jgi:hypothetical protein
MKRYVISSVAVLMVLAMVWVAFGQEQRARQGQRRGSFMGREQRLKAIETIETQLATLKEGFQQRPTFNRQSFQNMSQEERAKLREQFMKARQEQQKALQTILARLAALEGRRQPAPEGARYLIIATSDLKPIREAAVKEKATETAKLIEGLTARGARRGFRGRRAGAEGAGGGRPARSRSENSNR